MFSVLSLKYIANVRIERDQCPFPPSLNAVSYPLSAAALARAGKSATVAFVFLSASIAGATACSDLSTTADAAPAFKVALRMLPDDAASIAPAKANSMAPVFVCGDN